MRIALLAAAGMLVTTGACGGVDRTTSNSTSPTCGHGPNLVQLSSSVILGSADVAMTVGGRLAFMELSAPVATTDGKTILATWTAVDPSGGLQGHVVVARLGPSGVVGTSAPVDAPAMGVAAFDGTDFLVVGTPGGGPPELPSTPTSLLLERVGLDGSTAAAAQAIETLPGRGAVTSAVWTPRGLAVAWQAESSPTAPQTAVQLFDSDGLLVRGVAPEDPFVTDPNTGLRAFEPAAVALFRGQLVVANGHSVSTLDWLGGSAQTSQTKFTVSVPEKGGFPTLFQTGGQLRMWGSGGVSPESDSSWYQEVFSGAPGESFSQVGLVDESAITQESDGCGGAVTLSNRDTTLGVVSDTAPQRIVSLGTTLADAFGVAAMTATPSGFVVVWVADDAMHLSTLAWR